MEKEGRKHRSHCDVIYFNLSDLETALLVLFSQCPLCCLPLFALFSFLVSFQTYLFQWLCFSDLFVTSSEGEYYISLKCHEKDGNIFNHYVAAKT